LSIAAINWALNVVTDITATQKAILISLADRADEDGFCYPSYDDICRRSCASRKTLISTLKVLEELELITRHRRYSQSTIYRVNITPMDRSKMTPMDRSKITPMDRSKITSLTTNESSINNHKEFEEFWAGYPRKTNKAKAKTAFDRLSPKDRKAAMEALAVYPWSTEQRYIPHATTWIHGRRWEDEFESNEGIRELEI
jgi:DNA-binding MarR family transcriptional regulator